MKQLFLYLWFICMSTLTYAQQVTLSGKVEDAYTGNGLQGVMVTIRPAAGNRILKFTKTQADGSFFEWRKVVCYQSAFRGPGLE